MYPELLEFLSAWSWEPDLLVGLALAAGLYAFGRHRQVRQGQGREGLAGWRVGCFYGGLAALAVALLSPVCSYSEQLFFMHMVQHLLLVLVAAPLLWLGAPLLAAKWALPLRVRTGIEGIFAVDRPLGRGLDFLTHPLVAASLFVGTMGIWHLPPLFDAAQGREFAHDLEHLLFLGTALLYWWPVIPPGGGRRQLSYAAALPYLLPPMLEGNLIGALLTFADHPLYFTYEEAPRLWGMSALLDQQLAGLIMWVPGGMVYLIPMFVLLTRLLQQEEPASDAVSS